MGQSRWMDAEKGQQWKIKYLLCDTCENKLKNPMVCEAYPERKPSSILKGEQSCAHYIAVKSDTK